MTRRRKPGRQFRTLRTRLGLERLEDRSLLAVAAFAVNLYEDVGGVPGNPIAGDTVEVGETFFVEITAREFHPLAAGLRAVALDIAWEPTVLQEIDDPFDPAAIVTPHLPVFRDGTLDQDAGTIDDLRGMIFLASDVARPIGNAVPERFALLHFRALEPAQASPFSIRQGRSRIVTEPTQTLRSSSIDFEAQTITVVPPAAQAAPDPVESTTVDTTESAPSVEPTVIMPSLDAGSRDAEVPPPAANAPTLGLQLNLYEDAGGVPGNLIAQDAVEVGDSFFVEIAAQDLRDVPRGVGGLSVDVSWDVTTLQSLDEPFDPRAAEGNLITGDFPLLRSGTVNAAAGTIEDLGGVSLSAAGQGQPIGLAGPERFSLLHFRALAAADQSPFSVSIGSSGFGLVEDGACSPWNVTIESQTITVLPKTEPPQIEVSATSGPNLQTVQFTTELHGADGAPVLTPLVRPAAPDTRQFVEVRNSGTSPLTLDEVQVAAPDVSVTPALAVGPDDDVVLLPGQAQRFQLTYAPRVPNASDTSTQTFRISDGLVIKSNAANAPLVQITLVGASTFDADITYDGRVNIADVVAFDSQIGTRAGDGKYQPTADPNGDGKVDLGDFGMLATQYRLQRSAPEPLLSEDLETAIAAIAEATAP